MPESTLLLQYESSVFRELYDFHIARSILRQRGPAVTVLGNVVCSHGLHDCVAVNLLHKHFDISHDEQVVREYVGRTAYMKPRSVSHPNAQTMAVIPYLWQYADGSLGPHFYPLEFAEYSGNEVEQAKAEIDRVRQNTVFLREFADQLWDLGLEDVFGIALLCSRTNVRLFDGETMLETTDAANRVLTLEPVPEIALAEHDTTETLWTFVPQENEAIKL